MPEYEFEAPDGSIHIREYEFGKAPSTGSQVEINGVLCTRVFSRVRQTNARYEHVAHSLPPYDPMAKDWDNNGQPRFSTRKEIDEYKAKTGRMYV